MKIVFITNSYYPYYSAIGKCVYNIANEMKNEHEVIVLSNMSTINLSKEESIEEQKIIRVRTAMMSKRDKIIVDEKSKYFMKKMRLLEMFSLRALEYTKVIASNTTIQKSLVKKYLQELSKIKNIDIIIPTCYPMEAIIVSQVYKKRYKNDVKIFPLLFDKYSDSPTLHRNSLNKKIKYKKHLIIEEKMIKDSEKVYYVDSWIHQMENHFQKYNKKLIHIEHPLILDCGTKKNGKSEIKNINVVYTGVLDKKVRPPLLTLKIISKIIEKDRNIKFHFYVLGNCEKELNEFHNKYPENIINHGQVKSEIALSKVLTSNILLSVGNTDISLIPSKIYEYMSCGKPIIHFYNSDEDRIISLLDEYSLGYCVKQDGNITDDNIDKIINFLNNNKSNCLSFNEVEKIFVKATPKFISEKIMKSF